MEEEELPPNAQPMLRQQVVPRTAPRAAAADVVRREEEPKHAAVRVPNTNTGVVSGDGDEGGGGEKVGMENKRAGVCSILAPFYSHSILLSLLLHAA